MTYPIKFVDQISRIVVKLLKVLSALGKSFLIVWTNLLLPYVYHCVFKNIF